MQEYLHDAVVAVAGQDIKITALITDEQEQQITTDCCLMVHDKDGKAVIAQCDGSYMPEHLQWEFIIPADATTGLEGRYWYCVQHSGQNLCFKVPLYLKA